MSSLCLCLFQYKWHQLSWWSSSLCVLTFVTYSGEWENSFAWRSIRCWLSFYNWVIIVLWLLFLDFLTTQTVVCMFCDHPTKILLYSFVRISLLDSILEIKCNFYFLHTWWTKSLIIAQSIQFQFAKWDRSFRR